MTNIENLFINFSNSSPVARLGKIYIFGLPAWAFYTFGTGFLIVGLLLFALTPLNNRLVRQYKEKQLKKYKEDNKIKSNLTYQQSKLILPFRQKFKLIYPPVLGIAFVAIGISWISGVAI